MGMDVMGVNPKTKEGEYFRANCWSWRPICVALANSGAADHLSYYEWDMMAENSGGGPRSEETCQKMADDLEEWLHSSPPKGDLFQPVELDGLNMWIEAEPNEHGGHRFVDPEEEPEVEVMSAYRVRWEHIQEFVNFLRNCGDGFEVW